MKIPFVRRASPLHSLVFAAGSLLALRHARADANLTTLYTFNPTTDGNVPYAQLVEGLDGKFYGTNSTGGKQDQGTVYSIKRNGSGFEVLSAFPGTNGGNAPEGAVVQASDGNFYGTTAAGGANGYGTLYQVTPAGTLTVLSSFTNGDPGGNPASALVEGVDGLLYGTAATGGVDGFGTVFKAAVPSGVTAELSEFEGALDGNDPQSDLIQARDGNFYGTTSTGGSDNDGTFFQVTPAGVRTVLYNFTNGTDGSGPLKGVIQGLDNNFYGIAQNGGTGLGGVIFRIAVAGTTATFEPLYTFTEVVGNAFTSDGGLLQASDGNFYGTTYLGGAEGVGTLFRMTPSGAFTLLYSFTGGADGGNPIAGLTQGDDGKLYGTTAGQDGSSGTIFKADLGLPLPAPQANLFAPTTAAPGDTIEIKGSYFLGTTAVAFTGANSTSIAATSFTVNSVTSLSAVVPSGAVTGPILVTADGLTASTPAALTINSTVVPPIQGTTVNVVASDMIASFAGNNNGRFKVTRTTSDLSQPLTVIFKIGAHSTAVQGTDYNLVTQGETLAPITQSVTIPAGTASVGLKVVPITSATPRPDEEVIFKIKAGAGYTIGNNFKAVVSIAGDGG